MFFRIINRDGKGAEVLYNTNYISKIEVVYGVPDESGTTLWAVDVISAQSDPRAVRSYKIHIAGETIFLCADPPDAVTSIFEEIYKSAVKVVSPDSPPAA
jgi:hypothetical protein